VGKNIPTSRREKIQVHVEETDGVDEVTIMDLEENDSQGRSRGRSHEPGK
jgi:hypothetical protein